MTYSKETTKVKQRKRMTEGRRKKRRKKGKKEAKNETEVI